jgi:hypothetical protein
LAIFYFKNKWKLIFKQLKTFMSHLKLKEN